MKNTFAIVVFLTLSLALSAQEGCYTYFPNTIGSEWSYNSYDKRGRLTHSTMHTLKVLHAGAATVRTISFDEDGEPLGLKNSEGEIAVMEVDFDVECEMGNLWMPPESFTSSFFHLFQGLDAEVTGDNVLVSYADMANEESFPNYNLQIAIKAADLKIKIKVTERRIVDREVIETPAGTFDCFVIQQKTNLQMGFISKRNTTETWIAPGIGMVKSVTYKRNASVLSTTELNQINW